MGRECSRILITFEWMEPANDSCVSYRKEAIRTSMMIRSITIVRETYRDRPRLDKMTILRSSIVAKRVFEAIDN